MTELTQAGRQALAGIASRHGVSPEAVEHVLYALIAGQGTQAQFNHPDLGGMGQWSMGGMTMVGDMFNNSLKAKVDALCSEVAELMRQVDALHAPSALSSQTQSQGDSTSLFVVGGSSRNWWPDGLGQASSSGAQNRMRYAWFPETRRLAIDKGDGRVRVYDTGDHRIGGFSQQQSGDQSLSFTSQHGLVKLSELREVDVSAAYASDVAGPEETSSIEPVLSEAPRREPAADSGAQSDQVEHPAEHSSEPSRAPKAEPSTPAPSAGESTVEEADIFAKIERLAGLHAKGILTDSEYQDKKAELLSRI
ncbi:MAG: SHOCT domain-containing protein [Hoeflea sp.]|uniref:SHOCT domain-containing protein n=1 Tax=Hoeflea sp. TaxID=1940281 RepID=UPI0032EFA1E9